jgi:hypothetical protein
MTVGELVVATGLLAMMVVTVMVLFGQMLDATSKNALLSQGSFFAETVIERELYDLARFHQNPNNAAATRETYASDWISFTDDANQTEFSYRVDSSPAPVTANTDMGVCYSIRVEVRWWQTNEGVAQNRHGMGKMYLKRSRIVYVPKP